MVEGLKSGFDGVLVFGCHIGDCHYLDGNHYTLKRVDIVRQLLDLSGIGRDRVQLRWVSAAEGQLFANYVKGCSELIEGMGPFSHDAFAVPLAAVETALNSARLRWLMGMDHQLTEVENVYHEKINEEEYSQILRTVVEVEYQKAVILEVLKNGPLSVPQIAAAAGLPVYTVSRRLGDLERGRQVDLHSYEGTIPKFMGLAA
jgi:hypothetical protein